MTVTTINSYVYSEIVVPSGVTVSATSNAGGPTVVNFTAGTYQTISALRSQLATELNAQRPVTGGSWQAGFELAGQNGLVTLQTSNASLFSISWTDVNLRNILGFTADITNQTSVTATNQAKAFWRPDCTIFTEDRYKGAPDLTDAHQTRSPNGLVITHVGNRRYRFGQVRWSHCPMHKIWLVDELTVNESLQQFLIDCQWGLGHAWCKAGAKKRITTHDGFNVGHTAIAGWYWEGIKGMRDIVRRAGDVWDGLWSVTIPSMSTDS